MQPEQRQSLLAASIGTALVIAYAAWAAFQILVLNPLAAAPGAPLAEIHAEITSAQGWGGSAPVYITLGIGVALALVFLLLARPIGSPTVTAAIYLVLLVLGAVGYFSASFDTGMSLADTYNISGGDHSPWSLPLYFVSLGALMALVWLAARAVVTRRSTSPRGDGTRRHPSTAQGAAAVPR